jgi:predicted acylesterase/phospholipase RssA
MDAMDRDETRPPATTSRRRRTDFSRFSTWRHFADRHDGDGRPPRTAFVLSGGGNQGVAQVGMLRAVIERGIVPDVVIGCSAGALNGAAVAYSPNLTGIDQLDAVWTSLTAAEIFPGSRLSRAWNVVRRETYLFEATGLDALVDRATPARSFADLAIPLRVVTTDLDTGEGSCSLADRSSPRCWRAPRCRACSRSSATTAADSSTAAWSTAFPCGTPSRDRSTA